MGRQARQRPRQREGSMETIRISSEHKSVTNDDPPVTIATEAEFERWLIFALEWERRRLQQPADQAPREAH